MVLRGEPAEVRSAEGGIRHALHVVEEHAHVKLSPERFVRWACAVGSAARWALVGFKVEAGLEELDLERRVVRWERLAREWDVRTIAASDRADEQPPPETVVAAEVLTDNATTQSAHPPLVVCGCGHTLYNLKKRNQGGKEK